MKRWSACALAATLAFSTAMHAMAANPLTLEDYMALSGPDPNAHLAYGSAASQYVELFVPPGAGLLPVVVLLHGGCWIKEFQGIVQMRNLAGALLQQGIAVWNVEYRRLDEDGGGYPGTYQDAAAAFDLLIAEAEARHLDTNRLLVMGHSAGGHLAQWLASRRQLPATSPLFKADAFPIRNVIALGSIGDLRHRTSTLKETCGIDVVKLTGRPSAARTNVYADTSPAELLPNGSHTVLINGALDHVSPPQTALDYAARARRAGDTLETIVLPRASHFDEVSASSPAWTVILPMIQRAVGYNRID
jgi:acetyl esterase/lipase